MTQVLAFKMINGDEVVATVVNKTVQLNEDSSHNDNSYNVKNYIIKSYIVTKPHILKFQPIAPGQVGLTFVPWTLSNPEIVELAIPASAVILTFSPSDKVKSQYISQMSTV